MKKTKIFILVEGVSDQRILVDFIRHFYLRDIPRPYIEGEIHLENEDFMVKILKMSSWTGIFEEERQADIEMKTDEGYQCIVILDADNPKKDIKNGGFTNRTKRVHYERSEKKLDFELFLLPDNQNDGDLEEILIHAMPADRLGVFNCIKSYQSCLRQHQPDLRKNINKEIKNLYMKLYQDIRWDFDGQAFKPMKDFFDSYFIKINS